MAPYNVLFLCTGNSARSILAEAILNHRGKGAFTAHSAGCHPLGRIRPEALRQLICSGIPTQGLSSKSWDEFSAGRAPRMDFIFTVCDNAAVEVQPKWPGRPATAQHFTRTFLKPEAYAIPDEGERASSITPGIDSLRFDGC